MSEVDKKLPREDRLKMNTVDEMRLNTLKSLVSDLKRVGTEAVRKFKNMYLEVRPRKKRLLRV